MPYDISTWSKTPEAGGSAKPMVAPGRYLGKVVGCNEDSSFEKKTPFFKLTIKLVDPELPHCGETMDWFFWLTTASENMNSYKLHVLFGKSDDYQTKAFEKAGTYEFIPILQSTLGDFVSVNVEPDNREEWKDKRTVIESATLLDIAQLPKEVVARIGAQKMPMPQVEASAKADYLSF